MPSCVIWVCVWGLFLPLSPLPVTEEFKQKRLWFYPHRDALSCFHTQHQHTSSPDVYKKPIHGVWAEPSCKYSLHTVVLLLLVHDIYLSTQSVYSYKGWRSSFGCRQLHIWRSWRHVWASVAQTVSQHFFILSEGFPVSTLTFTAAL